MSGLKRYQVQEGISSTFSAASSAARTASTATAAVVTTGVETAATLVGMAGKALRAYQERRRKEREAAEQRERDIQRKIAEIRSRIGSNSSQSKVTVKLPQNQQTTAVGTATKSVDAQDFQRRANNFRARLPQIRSEYQALIDREILDDRTVQQALLLTEQALRENNLRSAEAHLQALDDARIEVIQQQRSQWDAQVDYLQDRLNKMGDRLPVALRQELQVKIDQLQRNWQQLADGDLESLHQNISAFESQADCIQQAAENLVKSWLQVGYVARIASRDNGDVIIEVETHEGANTQIRVQFDGQQIDLEGPPEETNSCAARTREAMQLFQEQGYQLEWTHLDNEPVPEEWRQFYATVPGNDSEIEGEIQADAVESVYKSYPSRTSPRRLESQRY